jgi:hypothetical protein
MTRLITFTDDTMTIAADICKVSALQNNVHEVKVYGPKDIDAKFRKANAAILDQPRGCGYWLWKPYFIDHELKKMKEGDYLIYCDAGVEIVNNVNHIIDRMRGDIWLFGNKWVHRQWCKADVYVPIMSTRVYDGQEKQAQASVMVIRNSQFSKTFVTEWLNWCCDPGMIDDSRSKLPNPPEFQEHRHDQAIITCLAYKEKLILHWWPAMYNAGNFTYEKTGYNDEYPVLFHHHRMRNAQFNSSDPIDVQLQNYFKEKYHIDSWQKVEKWMLKPLTVD